MPDPLIFGLGVALSAALSALATARFLARRAARAQGPPTPTPGAGEFDAVRAERDATVARLAEATRWGELAVQAAMAEAKALRQERDARSDERDALAERLAAVLADLDDRVRAARVAGAALAERAPPGDLAAERDAAIARAEALASERDALALRLAAVLADLDDRVSAARLAGAALAAGAPAPPAPSAPPAPPAPESPTPDVTHAPPASPALPHPAPAPRAAPERTRVPLPKRAAPPAEPTTAALRLQVFSEDSVVMRASDRASFAMRPLGPGLVQALVEDVGNGASEKFVRWERLRRLRLEPDEAFALARRQSAAASMDRIAAQHADGVEISIANSFYLSGFMVDLLSSEALVRGALVMPLSHHHWCHYVLGEMTQPRIVFVLEELGLYVAKEMTVADSARLGPRLYWVHSGGRVWERLELNGAGDQRTCVPSPALLRVLMGGLPAPTHASPPQAAPPALPPTPANGPRPPPERIVGLEPLLRVPVTVEGAAHTIGLKIPPAAHEQVTMLDRAHASIGTLQIWSVHLVMGVLADIDDAPATTLLDALFRDPAAMNAVLAGRARLYEALRFEGRVHLMCPHCRADTELTLLALSVALQATPWPLADDVHLPVPAAASLLRPRGARPAGVPLAVGARFVLPSVRLGPHGPHGHGVFGEPVTADRNAEAWRRVEASPSGRRYVEAWHPHGYNAVIRLAAALDRLGEVPHPPPEEFERLLASDFIFLDALYHLLYNVDVVDAARCSIPCGTCREPFAVVL